MAINIEEITINIPNNHTLKEIFGEFDDNAPLENIKTYQRFRVGTINYQQLKQELCNQISKD